MNEIARPYVLLLARIFMAAIFVVAGIAKILTADEIRQYMESMHVSGALLWPVVTAVFFHANFGDQNQLIHFMKNVAMAGGFLILASFGAGRISVDSEATSGFAEVRDRAAQGTP